MKTLFAAAALVAFTLVSCDQSQSPTQPTGDQTSFGKATVTKDIDLPFDVYDNCCDDQLTGTATFHLVVTDKSVHETLSNISLTGASGASYHGGAGVNETININNGASEESLNESINLTSSNGCKIRLHFVLHITINANGDVTSTVSNVTVECL